jgi:hypothetical protein
LTRKIFIGSASETVDELAIPIADRLSELDGYEVKRWWGEGVFRPGDVTHERLREIAAEVDGAVFVCKGTDRVTWMGEDGVKEPRDNVVFELGMFFQRLDPHSCVVVKDDATHLPSDLKGLTYIPLKGDADAVAGRVARHFQQHFNGDATNGQQFIPLMVDPYIADMFKSTSVPFDWHARALYYGTEGGQRWLAMVTDPAYLTHAIRRRMLRQVSDAVEGLPVSTLVAFGPGDSDVDRELVLVLTREDEQLHYIPVDLNEGLLNYSCRLIQEQGRAHVPFGLLTDFEDRMSFIRERLRGGARRPMLVTLLGNAFGNLDRRETSFMKEAQSLLKSGDRLLLEVAIVTPAWSLDKDIRHNVRGHSIAERYFYSQGLARQTGEGLRAIFSEYDQRIVSQQGSSEIKGTKSVDVVDSHTERVVISLRRYDWDEFKKWVGRREFGFEVERESSFLFDEGEIGIGAVLLRKK